MQTELLKVTDMTCGGCTSTVTNALKTMPGVGEVKVSLLAGEAAVQYDERVTSLDQMKSAVEGELCGNLGDAARSGGVVYRRFEDLDAVFESDTCDNLRQVICAFQPPPGF